ncbi:Alpha/beta hydrolase family protein [Legionella santicrucis]|uniref:Alpha/beta hydrolase family protein n=2 Tax=Legionella santicrucis TaxID=45074 RepID=A0A0W0YVK6_9GAMM|nr:Alpha/beta hydrolase family protein [Legionella santicrucis]
MKKIQLINQNICPDPFYREADKEFYAHSKNLEHCHMINLYLFFPVKSHSQNFLSYDTDASLQIKEDIKNNKIKSNAYKAANSYLHRLQELKSYVSSAKEIAHGKFPLIVFQPGWSFNSNNYQNFIVNLVSHGYIVAAIDSAYSATLTESFGYLYRNEIQFIHGRPSIKFMHSLFNPKNSSLSAMESDLNLVLNHLLNNLQDHIDVKKIGGMGHSLGAISIYRVSFNKNKPIKAFVSLDFGQSNDIPKHIYNPMIPSLIFRSAYDKKYGKERQAANEFILEKGSYLVWMTPNIHNEEYSKHSAFTDFITLISNRQLWELREKTYGNLNSPWYDSGPSFDTAKNSLGTANGLEFTAAVNQYVLEFFDYELKSKHNPFKKCKSLTPNSQLYCGPLKLE